MDNSLVKFIVVQIIRRCSWRSINHRNFHLFVCLATVELFPAASRENRSTPSRFRFRNYIAQRDSPLQAKEKREGKDLVASSLILKVESVKLISKEVGLNRSIFRKRIFKANFQFRFYHFIYHILLVLLLFLLPKYFQWSKWILLRYILLKFSIFWKKKERDW